MTSTAALLSQLEVQRQEFALQRQVLEQRSKLHQEHVAEFRKIHARSVTRVRAKLLAEGFDDYASKPIGRELLMKLCERWISESRDAA